MTIQINNLITSRGKSCLVIFFFENGLCCERRKKNERYYVFKVLKLRSQVIENDVAKDTRSVLVLVL